MQNIQTCKLQNLHRLKKMQNPDASQRSGLDWSGFLQFLHFFEPVQVLRLPGLDFLHFFEPVQVLEPWVLKTCTGSKKCKTSKPGRSKTCTGSTKCKNCKTQMQVRGQGLIGLDFCIFCICLSLCRFWSLGCLKPAQAQKMQKIQTWKLQNLHRLKRMQKMHIFFAFFAFV